MTGTTGSLIKTIGYIGVFILNNIKIPSRARVCMYVRRNGFWNAVSPSPRSTAVRGHRQTRENIFSSWRA